MACPSVENQRPVNEMKELNIAATIVCIIVNECKL